MIILKPFVIGIAGGSASGKTTFVEQFINLFSKRKILTFHMDAYFKKEKDRPIQVSMMNQKCYRDDNHPHSFHLHQLYQDICQAMNETYEIIIIEGLLTLYDEKICSLLDLKIFIDCRADERIVRRLKRNMNKGLSFDEISNVYLDLVRFRHDEFVENTKWKADLIVNGSKDFHTILLILKGYLSQKVTNNEKE